MHQSENLHFIHFFNLYDMDDKLMFLKILYKKKLEIARDELNNNENLTDLQVTRIRYEIKFILQLLKEINH